MENKGSFLQLQNIQKMYDDGYIACDNINISIDKGKFVTILGPSGCGKTTLLKMIAGFEMPTKGKIIVNGLDIKDVPIHSRPTATVFQDYALFPNMNVYDNIIYGLRIMRTELEQVPEKVYQELEKVRKDAVEKANKKIIELKNELAKIDKELVKVKLAYSKNEEVFKVQDMRYQQFLQQVIRFEKAMQKKNPEYTSWKLSVKNRRKIRRYKIAVKFGTRKLINFNTDGMNQAEKNLYHLLALCLYKEPIDIKVDKLLAKYADIDEWISYWENYPETACEAFRKLHTTRPLTKEEIKQKAEEAINLVGLNGNEYKFPAELSGGMQQRVALARAIVVKPDILLLDEPLSALDAQVRKKMQQELKRIHNELKINFILVTHDQEEALTLSDQIIVMSKGKIEQFGSAKNIYEHPANAWVANFIGQANFIDCEYLGNQKIRIGKAEIDYPITNAQLEQKLTKNAFFKLLVRPEDVEVCPIENSFLQARVQSVSYKGTIYEITCLTKDKIAISMQTIDPLKVNDLIGLKWNLLYTTPIIPKKGETL